MKIQVNKNPAGWLNNMEFAICQLGDGLVRVLSIGFLFSDLILSQTRRASRRSIKLKAQRDRTYS